MYIVHVSSPRRSHGIFQIGTLGECRSPGEADRMVHAVILPFPMHGHTTPALLLASKLASQGIKVSYVCSQFRLKQLECLGYVKVDSGIVFRGLHNNCPPPELLLCENGLDLPELVDWLVENDEADKEEFSELVQEMMKTDNICPPSCIISDLPWTGEVAGELGIPRFALHTSTALELAVTFHIKYMSDNQIFPTSNTEQAIRIPGILDPIPATEVIGMTVPILHDHFKRQSLGLHGAAGVFCNSFQELEPEALEALSQNLELNPNKVPILPIGPLVKNLDSFQGKEDPVLTWLTGQEPGSVLYISFGSFALGTQDQVQELAMGIEASGQRFLWVIHQSVSLPQGFEERTKEIGLVRRTWAPQAAILSHSSTGAFLSHCGWNSTIESICKGVPILALPFYDEQRANARLIVEKLGVGMALFDFNVCFGEGTNPLERQKVAQLVTTILRDKALKNKVVLLSAAAERAINTAGEKINVFLNKS